MTDTITPDKLEEIEIDWTQGVAENFERVKAALLPALEAEKKRADKAEDRAERFKNALQELQQWANAYPLDIFPEPNFSLAAKVLTDAGISLDAISASNMRHVLTRVEEITRAVLNENETGNNAR